MEDVLKTNLRLWKRWVVIWRLCTSLYKDTYSWSLWYLCAFI